MMQLSLPYSTGYMQSTISWICDFSRCFMKSLSWMASLMRSLDLKRQECKREKDERCQPVLAFGSFPPWKVERTEICVGNLVWDRYSLMPINKYRLAHFEFLLLSASSPQMPDFGHKVATWKKVDGVSGWKKFELQLSWFPKKMIFLW